MIPQDTLLENGEVSPQKLKSNYFAIMVVELKDGKSMNVYIHIYSAIKIELKSSLYFELKHC